MPKSSELGTIGRRSFLLSTGSLLMAAQAVSAQPRFQMPSLEEWHAAQSIPLWPNGTPAGGFRKVTFDTPPPPIFVRNVEQPFMRVFRPEKPNGRSLLSIPGGAYTFVSIANEGLDVAREMTARGYTVFVLVYRLPGEGWTGREDVPLQDVQRAIRVIKARSAEFACDPEQVYAVGFSAGGHLAATLATGFAEPVYTAKDAADGLSAKPRAVGLIYPVISQVEGIGHAESTLRLLGENPPMENVIRRSPDLHVGAETPPIFLVHAVDDPAVPLQNSILMLGALRGYRRPVEVHFFERGGHGFGTGVRGQPTEAWPGLFAKWIDSHAA